MAFLEPFADASCHQDEVQHGRRLAKNYLIFIDIFSSCRQSQEVGPSGDPDADSLVLASPMSTSSPVGSETIYRLVSVGQDCQMLLWDVVVRADDFLEGVTPG